MKTSLQLFILICFLFTVIKPDHAFAGTICGDVNLDHEINIADMNVIIDLILDGDGNLMADVNYDGEVNIADINAVIDAILSAQDSYEGRADVNGDGEANIADVNSIIDIILSN